MKTNLTCEASSPVGTRLRMTATSLLDPFPAARLASRESLSRRTGRWRLSYSEGRTESHCSLPTSGVKGGVEFCPKPRVWHAVGVLSAPPRSPKQTEISRFGVNSPELAGICARTLSLQAVDWISGAGLAPLSLPRKIAFPDSGERCWRRLGSNAGSVRRKAEYLVTHWAWQGGSRKA